jgi:hypothetical protein
MFSLDAIMGGGDVTQPTTTAQPQPTMSGDMFGLGDIFGANPTAPMQQQQQQQQPSQQSTGLSIDDMFGLGGMDLGGGLAQTETKQQAQPVVPQGEEVYSSASVTIRFACTQDALNPGVVETRAVFATTQSMTGFEFQVSVPKYIQMQLRPASSTQLSPLQPITQEFRLENQMHGQKKLLIRFRVNFTDANGQTHMEQGQIKAFPN